MKGWEQCPRCWGSGLLAFLKPCTQAPDLNLRDLTAEPLTQEEMVAALEREPALVDEVLSAHTARPMEAMARLVARILIKAVFRV